MTSANALLLTDPDGNKVIADEGESTQITAAIKDFTGKRLDVDAIKTLTATLIDERSQGVINGRQDQNILNANGGTLTQTTDGAELKLVLGPADNPVISASSAVEDHLLTVEWTWDDENTVEQTGGQVWRVQVAPNIAVLGPGLCRVDCRVFRNGNPIPRAIVQANLVDRNVSTPGIVQSTTREIARTDAQGFAFLDLVQGGQFLVGGDPETTERGSNEYIIEAKQGNKTIWRGQTAIPDQESWSLELSVT